MSQSSNDHKQSPPIRRSSNAGSKWRDPESRTQADRILRKFGGPRRLAKLLKAIDPNTALNPSSIYRWRYPRDRGGTGGLIPTAAIPLIQKAAVVDGILLSQEDLYPGPVTKRHWDDHLDGKLDIYE